MENNLCSEISVSAWYIWLSLDAGLLPSIKDTLRYIIMENQFQFLSLQSAKEIILSPR